MWVSIRRFQALFPGDTDDLDRVMREERINPESLRAIISKTDGSGFGNDYSRQIAEDRFISYLESTFNLARKEIESRILFITSSGCEGLITPHGYVIFETSNRGEESGGLVAGIAKTGYIKPDDIGTFNQSKAVAAAAQEALHTAGLNDPGQVGIVFVKSPIDLHDPDLTGSISATRRASAIGVGLALGEVQESDAVGALDARRNHPYSEKAFTFSGNELSDCRVLALGDPSSSTNHIVTRTFENLTDIDTFDEDIRESKEHMEALFIKVSDFNSGWSQSTGLALGRSDLPKNREIRAAASGVFATLTGSTEIFISVGAENQGPAGGGIMTIIYSDKNEE